MNVQATGWLERFVSTITDRGRELLGNGDAQDEPLPDMCRRLLDGRGEASNIALAHSILRRVDALDAPDLGEFLLHLAREFGPDPEGIRAAAAAYDASAPDTLMHLLDEVEPPRQELFRRLNMAPGGTATLVRLRARLLDGLGEEPLLRSVDIDMRHLLASWFNRGFLELRRIDWRSPAVVLEKLIRYESVHAINGWDDLHRRLADDRRCFGFFHPALPDDPLIFVEVALVHGTATRIAPLINPDTPLLDPHTADTAMFYSINNSLRGLRGISFGNFLLKQVLGELSAEFPQLAHFLTLSPAPGLAAGLQRLLDGKTPGWPLEALDRALEEFQPALQQATGHDTASAAVATLLAQDTLNKPEVLEPVLHRLALLHLGSTRPRAEGNDPVAAFHLSNGAILERLNPGADTSERGRRQAHGLMVNYRYAPEQVIDNHEAFVRDGRVAMSRALQREYARHLARDH